MECMDPESPDKLQVSCPVPVSSELLVPPELRDGESYHVFVSYSSTDLQWTDALIQQLENTGLRVCNHERDFTPGRPILENMSECIAQSQKVLLVLSQDFVKSRWCLLEANMSLFRDCLQRKPIVPVLLQKDLTIPLPLAHLTYLEVSHPDFSRKLLRVLCTPNHHLSNSTMVPYQPLNIYNGKFFQPLLALNEPERLNCGVWSPEVPPPLRRLIQDRERYRAAIEIINRVQREKLRLKTNIRAMLALFSSILFCVVSFLLYLFFLVFTLSANKGMDNILVLVFVPIVLTWVFLKIFRFFHMEPRRVIDELRKAVSEANTLLYQDNILFGAWGTAKLLIVYVSLDACRRELRQRFPEKDIFDRALQTISSSYVASLSIMPFPFEVTDPGHLEGGMCFCQCVRFKLDRGLIIIE